MPKTVVKQQKICLKRIFFRVKLRQNDGNDSFGKSFFIRCCTEYRSEHLLKCRYSKYFKIITLNQSSSSPLTLSTLNTLVHSRHSKYSKYSKLTLLSSASHTSAIAASVLPYQKEQLLLYCQKLLQCL